MEKIGLLAGVGRLPVECAIAAGKLGYEVYAVGLIPGVDEELQECVAGYTDINVAQLQAIIDYLKENGVHKVTMLGKVTKEILYSGQHVQPDLRMLSLIFTLPDRKDDTLMLAFINELAKDGLEAFDQTELIKSLMPAAGVLTRRQPTDDEIKDMKFGMEMAREIGRLDVGQTAVVKNLGVMALEAIEGTDACIRRGGELARGGAVVAKVAKPKQDFRFDVPAVGVTTLESMIAVGAKALVIEAGRTLLVDKARVVELADANDIAIVVME
ncbi:MAG: UDP-2,3-diacylglucosamine diphosphatase LpxI [Anaerovibrio sp.]|uniref:LpxI family protein n=1 Tax=Anaerovibrio sp. TaxID=1872532 RepID=UPI0025F15D48|nr:UDP-2,3-diacylglucosamine diphosphatase LpxI [Anaerovibrio sp.]MCR5176187.1 UDP-2,3-diacylglucosamine diphosphatase LpxI [Anaerovibrio sp.]